MLKLPCKKHPNDEGVVQDDGLVEFGMSQFGEAIIADLPDAVKTGLKAHMAETVDRLSITLKELEAEHAKKVQRAKKSIRDELVEVGYAGVQVLQKVQSAIQSATETQAATCTAQFKPSLSASLMSQSKERRLSLEIWRSLLPHWSAYLDIITRHLIAQGYFVKLSYTPPIENEDFTHHPGCDGSFDGCPTSQSWDYKNYGTVTMSFDM